MFYLRIIAWGSISKLIWNSFMLLWDMPMRIPKNFRETISWFEAALCARLTTLRGSIPDPFPQGGDLLHYRFSLCVLQILWMSRQPSRAHSRAFRPNIRSFRDIQQSCQQFGPLSSGMCPGSWGVSVDDALSGISERFPSPGRTYRLCSRHCTQRGNGGSSGILGFTILCLKHSLFQYCLECTKCIKDGPL
jgi:hypothetical protein